MEVMNLGSLMDILLVLPAMLIGITVHEYSHGRMADSLGDPTPRHSGRLSLNPIVHLDFLGSLMIIIAHFGWAKPVPVNPRYFKDPKRDMLLVGVAGPAANFATAFLFALPLRIGLFTGSALMSGIFFYIVLINVALGVFNLIPIPPLDGSHIIKAFVPPSAMPTFRWFEQYGIIFLFIFLFMFRGPFSLIISPILNLIMSLLLPGSRWV